MTLELELMSRTEIAIDVSFIELSFTQWSTYNKWSRRIEEYQSDYKTFAAERVFNSRVTN